MEDLKYTHDEPEQEGHDAHAEHEHGRHDEHCGCEHDHEHHHHHEHDDGEQEAHCGCGHDHEHEHHQHHGHCNDDDGEHDDHCGCGHDHDHEHHHHHEHHGGDDDEHDEHCGCGCGHDHDHEHHHHHEHHDGDDDEHEAHCGCGHDHGHHHHHEHGEGEHDEHEAHCGCGHDHEHHHHGHCDDDDDEHDEHCGCGCGHDHEHHHHHAPTPAVSTSKAPCTVYLLKNIDCANCSAKIEAKIRELPEVDDAVLTFATRQLRVYSTAGTALLPKMQEIADRIEPGTVIEPRTRSPKAACTVYLLENIDCANCAAKIEAKIRELPGVDDAVLTFATKQLRVYSTAGTALLPKMQEIADYVEPGTVISVREESHKAADTPKEHDHHSNDMPEILAGAVLFVAGKFLEKSMTPVSVACFIIAYLILGRRVLLTAFKNLKSGHVMDENFLMSIATLGAFAVSQFGEAVGVMLFYRIGEAFEHKAVEKSRSQIMEAVDLRPETVLLSENGQIREVPAEEAQVGQIIEVRPGDRIPLDGTIVEGESRIDTSPITGEPVPVAVHEGSSVLSGCVNTSGLLKLRVEKELSESMVTRILDSVENAAASKPKAERFITRFARIYTPVVVALALATAILPSLFTGNWHYWIYTALTFLVISCPCALVLSVPLAFFSGIGAGSKMGILFKGGVALEALKDVKAVVMDKTGTITRGNFVVRQVSPVSEVSADELLAMAASCETASTHPIGNSILTAARQNGLVFQAPEKLEELSGRGIHAVTSYGDLLCGNRKLMNEYQVDCSVYTEDPAATSVLLARDGKYIGSIAISDTVKPEAASAIASLKKLGIRTAMLTGDNESAANAVAKETGIDTVYAKLLPGDKLEILQNLRKETGGTMFVGDGINDAPVLAGADVGAAMGSGADAAIEAADVVFMTSSVEAIPTSIRIAKKTGAIATQNVVFALVIKICVMLLGLTGHASMWMAVFADTGVAMLCVLNSIRVLYKKM